MHLPDNSFFKTLSLLCQRHEVNAVPAFKKFTSRKILPRTRRAIAERACLCVTRLSAAETRLLGINSPAYCVQVERIGQLIVFIGTYRDGSGKTVSYADISTAASLHDRAGGSMSFVSDLEDDVTPKSGGIAELISAARTSGEEGLHQRRGQYS